MIKVLSHGDDILSLDDDAKFRNNGQNANRVGARVERYEERERGGRRDRGSSRFECEHASAKVFALNWDRSRGIYVRICSTCSCDLPEIFEERKCVVIPLGATHRLCLHGILMRCKKRFPKQYASIVSKFSRGKIIRVIWLQLDIMSH